MVVQLPFAQWEELGGRNFVNHMPLEPADSLRFGDNNDILVW
jgi:hypothetical protein